ncbi:hypothetical protein V7150_16895 [Neobacillus drentensis]|uniref:hypothetical protein n=1 Tax=Neobacillus drentensis TaxID=220684 RepID=UPI002FFF24F9
MSDKKDLMDEQLKFATDIAYKKMVQTASVQFAGPKSSAVSGVVFCRNCGNQYDSTHTVCSSYKTPR